LAIATDTPTVRAQAKWVRTSPRKARIVAEHIRGRSVPEARTVLAFTPRAAARDIERVLASAVANAESRDDLRWRGEDLFVAAIAVDEGPTLKRWRARARGRVARIKKRTCHITVTLAQAEVVEAPAPKPKRAAAAPKADATTEKPRTAAKPKAAAKPEAEAKAEETKAEEPKAEAKPKRTPRRKKTEEAES
jgi:large subunit ribosomal protein L22